MTKVEFGMLLSTKDCMMLVSVRGVSLSLWLDPTLIKRAGRGEAGVSHEAAPPSSSAG